MDKLWNKLRKNYLKFVWLPKTVIIGIQSSSSQLYEIIINYLFNVT